MVPTLARNWWATAPGAAPAEQLVLALGHLLVENDLVLAHTVGLDLLLGNLPVVASLHELGDLADGSTCRIERLLNEFIAIFKAERVEVPDALLLRSSEGLVTLIEKVLNPVHDADALLVHAGIKSLGLTDPLAVELAVAYVALFLAVEDFLH